MTDLKQIKQVPAVERAFTVIDYISRSPGATFTSIRQELNIPKSSLHTLLNTLVLQGILCTSSGGGYTLGLRLFELGSLAVGRLDIRKEAQPLMHQLVDKVQLTCHLGILEGTESVYLVKVECKQAIVVKSWEGKRGSLIHSAMGKSLLLMIQQDELEELVQKVSFAQHTPSSISSREAFFKHLEIAKHRGWTIDDEEDVHGIRCVGAPVLGIEGQPMALSISGPIDQVPYHRVEELAESVMETARQLSHNLGVRNVPG